MFRVNDRCSTITPWDFIFSDHLVTHFRFLEVIKLGLIPAVGHVVELNLVNPNFSTILTPSVGNLGFDLGAQLIMAYPCDLGVWRLQGHLDFTLSEVRA